MPIPNKKPNEDSKKFVARCMSNETMKKDYPDIKQRVAICLGQTKKSKSNLLDQVLEILGLSLSLGCEDCDDSDDSEELTLSNLIFPKDEDYVDFGEATEEYDVSHITAAEYQGRKVTLNKPFRTPGEKRKFAVYVKNPQGKVIILRFGDPSMTIKKHIPERRKSFRARMRCQDPGPKWKRRYWACWAW